MSFRAYILALFAWFAVSSCGTSFAANSDFFYFYKGDTPENWHWVLQDPTNWWLEIQEGNQGVSGGGKLTLGPSETLEFAGAVKAAWDKGPAPDKNWGGLSISGRSVDLSPYEHVGELTLALRLEVKPKKDVKVKMLCQAEKEGDKCEGEVFITSHLKKAKLNEWFVLPIPLDCFVVQGNNFDLKKIRTPVEIGTDGKMILHIAEISIQKMVPGDEGCVPNQPGESNKPGEAAASGN